VGNPFYERSRVNFVPDVSQQITSDQNHYKSYVFYTKFNQEISDNVKFYKLELQTVRYYLIKLD